jgi:membrane-associated phospholipid phosphatase
VIINSGNRFARQNISNSSSSCVVSCTINLCTIHNAVESGFFLFISYLDIHWFWQCSVLDCCDFSVRITSLGDGKFSIGLFGGFVGYGLIFKDAKAWEVGKIGIESFLLTGITVQIFKNLCGRERPSVATCNGGFWHGPFSYLREPNGGRGISSFDAFPSGHTATVFAAATTISDFYTESWVPYTCYSLAVLTAISRITESTHWMSDCFVGAIIGYYGTKLVEKWNYGSGSLTLLPQVNERYYGILLSIKL